MSLASAQFSRACAPAATRASRRGRRSTVVVRAGVFGASSTATATATATRIGTQGTRAKGSRRTRRTGGARGERRRDRARVARGGREIDELRMFYARADVTVSDTKQKFLQAYPYPIPSVWSTITQELLVQGHFAKYNVKSEYNALASLGFVSVFDQLYEGFPSEEEKGKIFSAFLSALGEDPAKTRADAETLGAFASSADGVEGLKTNPIFASTKEKSDAGKLLYTRYLAIGIFRMLELAKATDPKALEALVEAGGLQTKKVNGDLSMYKGLLSKLAAAKELQEEFLEREKRKTAERMAKKEATAAAAATQSTESSS